MKKAETIRRHGIEAYNREMRLAKIWSKNHPEKKKQYAKERNRPGGIYYETILRKNKMGLRHERANRRSRDGQKYRLYKKVIDPTGLTQLHHSWFSGSSECEGIALVEADAHMHGIIDVIEILDGKIKLFTEKEIAAGGNIYGNQ